MHTTATHTTCKTQGKGRRGLSGRGRGWAAWLTLGALATPAQAVDLRVLVATAPTLTVSTQSAQSNLSAPAAPLRQTWQVGVSGTNLTLGGQDTGSGVLYLPPSPGSQVDIGTQSYRGGVLLRVQGRQVQAINVVDVEDYLRGVVPAEMPASWPAEALAAQAIIARTYAAAHISPSAPYDTCATEQCQVYRGIRGEKAATDAAIRATAGRVLVYGNAPAQTFFSSDSGGYVASSDEVWKTKLPYLVAKEDPFSVSAAGPKAQWVHEVALERVRQVASRYRVQVGALREVRVSRASESGRVQQVTLSGSGGTKALSGAEAGGLLRALGASSHRVTLEVRGATLIMRGRGNGHGVGLSQYGALGMARAGYDHLHMLGFYYPGTSLGAFAARSAGPPSLALRRALETATGGTL